ncbi:MAG TPA: hypothetical protein VJ140_02525 [Actinomycetota bacterium]|nr:hypothetical protein [Actinomycetota bacterium]
MTGTDDWRTRAAEAGHRPGRRAVHFGRVSFRPGEHLCCDEDGVVVLRGR